MFVHLFLVFAQWPFSQLPYVNMDKFRIFFLSIITEGIYFVSARESSCFKSAVKFYVVYSTPWMLKSS